MPDQDTKSRCFIAMPITTHPAEAERYGDPEHWDHVMQYLFVPAIELAGYEPVIPIAKGSHLIHDVIIRQLSECELVLCDLSSHNPNVFFELGVRTSLNLPVALVHDGEARLPFDTSGINTLDYRPALHGWELEEDRQKLAQHVVDAVATCAGANPMWKKFGLEIKAHEPQAAGSPLEAKLDLLAARLEDQERLRGVLGLTYADVRAEPRYPVERPNPATRARAERIDELERMLELAQATHDVKLDLRVPADDDNSALVVVCSQDLPGATQRELQRSAVNRGFSLSFAASA